MPLAGLLSDRYAAERRALITEQGRRTRSSAGAAGDRGDAAPRRARRPTAPHASPTSTATSSSYTFTIESTGGNGIVVPGYGFLLNNELTDFDIDVDDRTPTAPRAASGRARSIAPTIVTRDGKPFLAVGSPGGATIITTVLQMLVDRLDLGKTLPEAIAAPRVSQRNAVDERGRAGVHRIAGGAALIAPARPQPVPRAAGEIGAATGIEFLARRAAARRRGAGPARRRQRRGGQASASEVLEHGQQGAGVVDDGVRVRQRLDRERAGGDRRDAHAVGARAGDVARRVADHDRPLARPVARRGARAIGGSSARDVVVGAEAALARLEVVARCPARPSLSRAIGSRLPVTSESRNSSGRAASAVEQLGDARARRDRDRSAGHSAS